ncbi:MAG: nucleotide sugar epimerase [Bradymonadaceae bacterium]
MDFITTLEEALGREADKRFRPKPPGDVESTCADVANLADAIDFRPTTDLEEGLERFVDWFRAFRASRAESAAE